MSNGREDFDLTFSGRNKSNSVYFEDEVVRNTNSNLISIADLNNNNSSGKNPNLKLNLKSIVNNDNQVSNISDKNKSYNNNFKSSKITPKAFNSKSPIRNSNSQISNSLNGSL